MGKGSNFAVLLKWKTAQLFAVFEDFSQLPVSHAVPNVLDLSQHEVFHVNLVGVRTRGQDVWQVGQLLNHDNALVARRLQQLGYGIGYQHGYQH